MDASPLERAIEVAGGQDAFQTAVGVKPRTLADWRRFGVPDTRIPGVEAVTDGRVTAAELATDRVRRLKAEAAKADA